MQVCMASLRCAESSTKYLYNLKGGNINVRFEIFKGESGDSKAEY